MRGADGAALLRVAGLQDALTALRRLQAPLLNWAGKAERAELSVPTLPLFVHERLSTAAIIQTLEGHRKAPEQEDMFRLFADPVRPMAEQVRAYSFRDAWVNRLILGDSLLVMNSLRQFEGLGGQVQMIYFDPPYGVKFGSNFQPFVRKRDVSASDDADMTREPEMVQAYRDTWVLGLHSYLTYLRDRLTVARELLTPSGSIFVQISDENLHHVREVMDEIFGNDNYAGTIFFLKTSGKGSEFIDPIGDYLIWYVRDSSRAVVTSVFTKRTSTTIDEQYNMADFDTGETRRLSRAEIRGEVPLSPCRRFMPSSIYSDSGGATTRFSFQFHGGNFTPLPGYFWRTNQDGMDKLVSENRIVRVGNYLRYKMYADDFPWVRISNCWDDVRAGGFGDAKIYVVQTTSDVVARCMMMTTKPGDLVLDPTCGSGTTAYVAEQWGRRWITVDTSRVPLALARQRLLTATFAWHRLRDEAIGPGAGFVYARRKNRKGEEVGGIVPHVTLKSITNNEPPGEEVLVDRPEADEKITRVTGPFVVEATLPTPQSPEEADAPDSPADAPGDHIARMIEVLRRAPTLGLPGNRRITLKNIRRPARSLALSAEAMVDHDTTGGTVPLTAAVDAAPMIDAGGANTGGLPFSGKPVAILIGPADGPLTGRAVLDAAKEANVKGYAHLFAIGFAITAEGRSEIEGGEAVLGLPVTYVTATMDLQMGDLLRNQRSSQIFAVCGLPDVEIIRLPEKAEDGTPRWQVRLLGLDVFDPVTMQTDDKYRSGNDVPAWMLDTRWNGMVFHADQVFFPRTSAWDNLRKALKTTHDDSVWAHLAGDISAPFAAAEGSEIAVKVLDDRGNELPVIRRLGAA